MAEHIRKCPKDEQYTLEAKCPDCHTEAVIPRPPKFSLQDKYSALRREAKKQELSKKGLY